MDATHRYMFVFLIAGVEVVTSALVLTTGNFFCIKKKPEEEPHCKEEVAEIRELKQLEDKAPEGEKPAEAQQFLKEDEKQNGEVATNPETCV